MIAGHNPSNPTTWPRYVDVIRQVTTRPERKIAYDEMRTGLEDGEMLLAECELAGAPLPVRVVIPDLAIYNWVMDLFEDPFGRLMSVAFKSVSLSRFSE